MIRRIVYRILKRRRCIKTQVLFYASSVVDELWVRSTLFSLSEKSVKCALVVGSGRLADNVAVKYNLASVPVYYDADLPTLRSAQAKALVTATSGVPADWFSKKIDWRIHMPHSIASLHMIYAADCFDGYNVLFAVGRHHKQEFELISSMRALKNRRVFCVGYGKMDVLRERANGREPLCVNKPHVLLAPSWGVGNIINVMGVELVKRLLREGYMVTLRPHPLFFIEQDPALAEIEDMFSEHGDFVLESSMEIGNGMFDADILITDYSGTAQEFAGLRQEPVIFVDVPKKVLNPNWEDVGVEPIELMSRNVLGPLVSASLDDVLMGVRSALESRAMWREKIRLFTPNFISSGQCADMACDAICELIFDNVSEKV